MVGKRVMVYKKLPFSVPALHTGTCGERKSNHGEVV